MSIEILNQLEKLHNQKKYSRIIKIISNLPHSTLTFSLINHLGRAYSDNGDYNKALETLYKVSEAGKTDSLWNFTVGYTYFHKSYTKKALVYLKQSALLGNSNAAALASILDGTFKFPKYRDVKKVNLKPKTPSQTKFEKTMVNLTSYFPKLQPGISIYLLESYILKLLKHFTKNKTTWNKGIELLNDLIYLKKHDNSIISKNTCIQIFNWIKTKYNNKIFEGFPESYSSNEKEYNDLMLLMNSSLDTLLNIQHNVEILPYINLLLKKSSNDFEINSLKNLIRSAKYINSESKQKISIETLNKVLIEADKHFEDEYNANNGGYLFCGLKETINEHKLCYTINWCIKSQKYLSNVKRGGWVGAGPLMISKTFDKFEMMGSSPGVDWIYLFELKAQNLEEYFYLEIPFENKNISILKSAIKCTTNELLNMVNDHKKIIYTQSKSWCDHFPIFKNIADILNNSGINCQIEIKIRRKT